MEDLDDLFDDSLGEQINDQLSDHLTQQIDSQLHSHLHGRASSAPPQGLTERLEELSLSGCASKIAWSKTGSIAHITKDRRSIKITNLRFQSSDATWAQSDYTDPLFQESIQKIYKGRQLTHVAWNPNQISELVVSDTHGRIGIFSVWLNSCINRLHGVGVLSIDPEDSLNALVGLYWLNFKRTVPQSRAAQKVDDRWKYHLTQLDLRGPYAPNNKTSFLAITRGGLARLGYQISTSQGQPHFQEARYDLDGFSSSGDLITHAALCADKDDTILVAVHTYSKQLRLYSMKIDWHVQMQGDQTLLNPTIECQHLSVIDACCPTDDAPLRTSSSGLALCHMNIIPRGADPRETLQPQIFVVFTGCKDIRERLSESQSILSRWELREESPSLDESFSKLTSKNSGTRVLKAALALKRQGDLRYDQIVLSVEFLGQTSIIALASPDGAIEFRDRDLSPLVPDVTPDRFTSLFHLGFEFDDREPCLYTSLSPNATVKAFCGKELEIRTSSMELSQPILEIGEADKLAGAFVIANALSEGASNVSGNTNDDLLMTMRKLWERLDVEARHEFNGTLLKDFCTLFGFNEKLPDGSSIEKTIRQPTTARCLSLQAAMGDGGEKFNRSLPSKIAYMALNMRNFALSSSMAFAKSPGSSEPEIYKYDVLQFLAYLTSWFGTLADHICDQLLDLNRVLDLKTSFKLQAIKDRVGLTNNPVLHMILSTFTRSLLRYDCRVLRSLAQFSQTMHGQTSSPIYHLCTSLSAVVSSSITSTPIFETLLNDSDEYVGNACKGLNEEQRQDIEFKILVYGEIPDILSEAVESILTKSVDKIRSQSARPHQMESDLAFKDWRCLGLLDDRISKRWRHDTVYDEMRKIELPKESKTKSCTRCAALIEDIVGPKLFKGGRSKIFEVVDDPVDI